MNNEQELSIHEGRGRLYRFFSNVFLTMPDEAFYQQINDMVPSLEMFVNSIENAEAQSAVESVKQFLASKNNEEQLLKYTSMFCIPEAIMLEESYYSLDSKMVMQQPYEEMVMLFAKFDYKLPEHLKVHEDNLVSQLFFMSSMAFATVDAIGNEKHEEYKLLISEQNSFHINRFDKWIDTVCDRIINFPIDEQLYKSITVLLLLFIKEDKILLSELA